MLNKYLDCHHSLTPSLQALKTQGHLSFIFIPLDPNTFDIYIVHVQWIFVDLHSRWSQNLESDGVFKCSCKDYPENPSELICPVLLVKHGFYGSKRGKVYILNGFMNCQELL